jgi:hypothetical protein
MINSGEFRRAEKAGILKKETPSVLSIWSSNLPSQAILKGPFYQDTILILIKYKVKLKNLSLSGYLKLFSL